MDLLLQLIIIGILCWWSVRVFRRKRHEHRERSKISGEHDAGVWVNPHHWERIVAELEGEKRTGERRDRSEGP